MVKGSIDRREEPGKNQGLQSLRSITVAALQAILFVICSWAEVDEGLLLFTF